MIPVGRNRASIFDRCDRNCRSRGLSRAARPRCGGSACGTEVDSFFFITPLIETQVSASLRVLSAAMEAGVRQIVRLFSRAAGWDQRSKLRHWQREIDDAVRESGAGWTILRPCSFFQNFIQYQAKTIGTMSSPRKRRPGT